jgi:crotonobetainyl-CoA:carnitine CoA-transferase CaiB-like acyl-CoA transferase
MATSPFHLSRGKAAFRSPPPLLGQHTEEILGELGYDPAAIRSLREAGVI